MVWNRCLSIALVFTLLGLSDVAAQSAQRGGRLDTNLRAVVDQAGDQPQRVIIRTRAGSRAVLQRALTDHGDRILAEHESLDAITALVHAEDVAALAQRDGILSVSTDAVVRADGLLGGVLGIVGGLVRVVGTVLLPGGADTSGVAVPPAVLRSTLGINDTTWAGRGVGIAVIDSGLEMSYEFQGRVRAFYDFTTGGVAPAYPYDDFGHGTHVASTIGGSGALSRSNEYRGLAPRVDFVVLKVLDKTGAGWTSDVIRAIDFAVAHRSTLGIDIINLSLGHPIYEVAATDPLVQAVERAVRAGVVVVAAAGNYGKNLTTGVPGYAGITSPGNAPSAITVGALRTEDTVSRSDDRIADYSSAGPTWYDAFVKPDIVAPGHNIVAAAAKQGTLYKTYPQLTAADGDYMRLSGTSMAAAVATGSVARLLEAHRAANGYTHPPLTPNAVKAVLHYTAFEIRDSEGVEYDPLRQGAGALNTKGATELAQAIDTSAAPGTWWLSPVPRPWTRIGGQDLAWKQGVIWGTEIIWGTTISVNHSAWTTNVVWGSRGEIIWGTHDEIIWGTHDEIIWGTNLVWTDAQRWADEIIWGTDTIGVGTDDAVLWGATGGLSEDTVAWRDLDSTSGSGAVNATLSSAP